MQRFLVISTFLGLLLAMVSSLAMAEDSSQNYRNQAGSTMTLYISDRGEITGSYTTALGCGVGIDRSLVGWKNGNAITFIVNFGECGSLTSWVGHIQDNGDIVTIWTLARGGESWDAKLTGTSTFMPIK
jgi:hypothetical protein